MEDGRARACTQYTIFLLTLSCRCCLRNSQRRRRLCGSCRRFGMLIRLDKCKLSEGWWTHTGPVTALCACFYPIDREIYWGVGKLDLSSWFDGKKMSSNITVIVLYWYIYKIFMCVCGVSTMCRKRFLKSI